MNSTYLLLYEHKNRPEYGNANQFILSFSDEDVEAYQQKHNLTKLDAQKRVAETVLHNKHHLDVTVHHIEQM